MFNGQKLHHSRACILTLTTQLALKGAVKINDLHLKNSTNNDNKKGNAKFQLHAAADYCQFVGCTVQKDHTWWSPISNYTLILYCFQGSEIYLQELAIFIPNSI